MMRTMRWRARCTSRPGVCRIAHRRVLGRASVQVPVRHRSWIQRSRSAARATVIVHAALVSKLVNGNRHSLESFKRAMCCSTWAWARGVASRSTGSPGWSV